MSIIFTSTVFKNVDVMQQKRNDMGFANFFMVGGSHWGLNSGFQACKQELYRLSHTSCPICSDYFGNRGLLNYLPGLVSNLKAPDFSLPIN
jgi:hypothetical protein